MGVDVIHGIVSNPSVRNIDEERPIPIDPATDSVRVVLAAGGIIPVASWKSSGTLVGAAGAVTGYAADVPNALATTPIEYARGGGSTRVKVSVFVTTNSFTVAGTTLTVFRNGVATAATIVYAAAAVGLQQATVAVAFADGDRFDLQVTNPGNGADVAKTFEFGASVDFLLI